MLRFHEKEETERAGCRQEYIIVYRRLWSFFCLVLSTRLEPATKGRPRLRLWWRLRWHIQRRRWGRWTDRRGYQYIVVQGQDGVSEILRRSWCHGRRSLKVAWTLIVEKQPQPVNMSNLTSVGNRGSDLRSQHLLAASSSSSMLMRPRRNEIPERERCIRGDKRGSQIKSFSFPYHSIQIPRWTGNSLPKYE